MRRSWPFPLGDLLLAQLVPGFLLAIGWMLLYEVYHPEGSYYTTLLQEILESEGLFPYLVLLGPLMAIPVGMVVDSVRHVVGEVWLRLPRIRPGRRVAASSLHWLEQVGELPEDFEERFVLYRHAWAVLLTPAKAAGNLALVLLVLGAWFVVKVFRMGGLRVFSAAFVVGTPLVGLVLVVALFTRYLTGVGEFHRRVQESIFPPKGSVPPEPTNDAPPSPS